MLDTARTLKQPNPAPLPITPESGEWQKLIHTSKYQAHRSPSRRRFDRVTLGFWLGGGSLGTAGCIFGAFMAYGHPITIALSVFWWGSYFGCIGALLGLLTQRTSASPSRGSRGAGKRSSEAGNPAIPVPELHLCSVGPDTAGPSSLNLSFTQRSFPCLVGRHPACHHRLASPLISRLHCAFSVRGGRVWVEDLGSRNGTHVNGKPVKGLRPLHHGDRLNLGYLPFQVRLAGRPQAEPGST